MKEFLIWGISIIAVIGVICFVINILVTNYYTSRVIGIILSIVALIMAGDPDKIVAWVIVSAFAITFLLGKAATEEITYVSEGEWVTPLKWSITGKGTFRKFSIGGILGILWWVLLWGGVLSVYAFIFARHWPVLYFVIPIVSIICIIIDFIIYIKRGQSEITGSERRR